MEFPLDLIHRHKEVQTKALNRLEPREKGAVFKFRFRTLENMKLEIINVMVVCWSIAFH